MRTPAPDPGIEATRQTILKQRSSEDVEELVRWAARVGHEINNQLTVIHGLADTLRTATHLPSDLRRDVADIEAAALRAAQRTRSLLEQSRKLSVRLERLDVVNLVSSLDHNLRRMVGPSIRIETEVPDRPCWVHGDPESLREALVNLVLNARDAVAETGEIRLIVAEKEDTVDLTVRDDGHGMDEDTRNRIFEPFFSTKPRGSGTGWGLAQVKEAVGIANGHIEVASTPGDGTEFRMRFLKSH